MVNYMPLGFFVVIKIFCLLKNTQQNINHSITSLIHESLCVPKFLFGKKIFGSRKYSVLTF